LATFVEHIAIQVSTVIENANALQVLVTGGGAFNGFLLERMESYLQQPLTVGNEQLVQYKEALIFAFLGVLRMENIPNSLPSITGANSKSIGGALWG
jgi:anhydro-N-acetylmuramic acid kinase